MGIGSCMPAKARAFFTADTFLKFRRDRYGRIDNQAFQLSAAKGWSRAHRLARLVRRLFELAIHLDS